MNMNFFEQYKVDDIYNSELILAVLDQILLWLFNGHEH